MKKILIAILLASQLMAYSIGGAYASLISCDYKQYGLQNGYVGTYKSMGNYYTVFFGNNYCQY